MSDFNHPICLLKTIWRSVAHTAHVSGHDFVTIKEPTPPNVHVIECGRCGAVSVAWSWDSLEGVK